MFNSLAFLAFLSFDDRTLRGSPYHTDSASAMDMKSARFDTLLIFLLNRVPLSVGPSALSYAAQS